MPKKDGFLYIYCLFCRTGSEVEIGREIERRLNNVQVLAAIQEKHRVINGQYEIDRRIFLPGYLFLYAEEQVDFELIKRIDNVYRVLGDSGETIELHGSDRAFAEWLRLNEGVIGISRIQIVDGKLKIISGPMRYFVEDIVRLDKHTRNALVKMNFLGKKNEIWLAFEFEKEIGG